MTGTDEVPVSETQLRTLNQLAEVITPTVGGFPSAEEADPQGDVLAMALAEFARDLPLITAYLDQLVGDAVDLTDLDRLEAANPQGFGAICDLLVGRYLTCRSVWKLLGYPGRVPAEPKQGETEFYLRDNLLDPVIARGPIFTPVPD
jgi:hypothetical protein